MAFEIEAWWSANYNKYSIRDMQRLAVFHRFVQVHYPFEHKDEKVEERFWTEGNEVDVFQWTLKDSGKTESFSHDRKLNQYHYELRYTDDESPVTQNSWFCEEKEWGTIVRDYGAYKLEEGWRLDLPDRTYERFTYEMGIKRGFRAGIHPYKGEYERWVEEIWEIADERMYTKEWSRQGENGGEANNFKGDYKWGTNWFNNTKREERKCWHLEDSHSWGHTQGREGLKTRWDHSWDFAPTDKYEEKVAITEGRDTGYRYWGRDQDWYKQEWEGLKLLEREDRCEEVVNSKFRSQLDDLYVREHNGTLKQQQTLTFLLAYMPDFAARVNALEKRRNDIHAKDRESIPALFDSISGLRDVQDDQEKLTQDMLATFRDDLQTLGAYNQFFLSSFKNSMLTLEAIGDVLKDKTAHEETVPLVEAWKAIPGKTFVKGKQGVELLEKIEQIKRDELGRFQGGFSQEEIEKAMDTLYQIMVKHDAVSDKIVELTLANDFKEKLDGMEDTFEAIHKGFLDDSDPNRLHEMLGLLLEYQPIHLHLVGRIRGFNREETNSELGRIDSAVADTKGAPSLKNTRAKVRSGKPTRDTPFQVMDKNLKRFAPMFQKLLAAVDAPKADIEAVGVLASLSVETTEPVEVLMEKTRVLVDVALHSDPCVDSHNSSLQSSDSNINTYFSIMKAILETIPGGNALIPIQSELVGRSAETIYLPPLLKEKTENLLAEAGSVRDFFLNLGKKAPLLADILRKFVPHFVKHLKTVDAPQATTAALDSAVSKPTDQSDPLESVKLLAETLVAQAEAADASVDAHSAALKDTDANVNEFLAGLEPLLEKLPEGETLVPLYKELVSKTAKTVYFPPLLFDKSKSLRSLLQALSLFFGRYSSSQDLSDLLSKFIPYFLAHLRTVSAPDSAAQALTDAAAVAEDKFDLLKKARLLAAALLQQAETAAPSVETHNAALKKIDDTLNEHFQSTFSILTLLPEGEALVPIRKALIAKSSDTHYFPPLLQDKSEALAQQWLSVNALFLRMRANSVEAWDTLRKFIPLFEKHLKTVDAPQATIAALDSAVSKPTDQSDPLESVKLLAETLVAQAEAADASVDAHSAALKDTDANVNEFLVGLEPLLEKLPEGETLVPLYKELASRTANTVYFPPLLFDKSKSLRSLLQALSLFFGRYSSSQDLSDLLSKFIPYFLAHLRTVSAPDSATQALTDAAAVAEDKFDLLKKARLLAAALLQQAETAAPSVETHNTALKKIDDTLNEHFQSTFSILTLLPEGEVLVPVRKALVARSADTHYFPPLLQDKSEALSQQWLPVSAVFQRMRENSETAFATLRKFIPLFVEHLKTVNAPEGARNALEEIVKKEGNTLNPAKAVKEQAECLLTQAEQSVESVATHNSTLKSTDHHINTFFESVFPHMKAIPDGEALVAPRQALIDQSPSTIYFPPLLLQKSEALTAQTPVFSVFFDLYTSKCPELIDLLSVFIPFFISHLHTVNAPASTTQALESVLGSEVQGLHYLEMIREQAETLLLQAQTADASLRAHNDSLKTTDANVNDFFNSVIPRLAALPGGKELVTAREALVKRTKETAYFPPLLQEKSEALKSQLPAEQSHQLRFTSKIPTLAGNLSKFIPYFVSHLKTVGATEEQTSPLSEVAAKAVDEFYPLEAVAEQIDLLLAKAEEGEAQRTEHEELLKQTDDNINKYYEETFQIYANLEGGEETIIEPRRALIAESAETAHFPPLLLRKSEDLLTHSSDLLAYIGALNDEITTITESNTTIIEELQITLNEKSELIDQLQKKIKELERRIVVLNEDLEDARKYKPLYEERDQIATKLALEVKELTIKTSDLTLERDKLKSDNDALTEEVRVLTDFKLRALDLEQENSRLQGIIKSYDSVLGDKKMQFETIIENLNKQIAAGDARIKELLEKIEELMKEIESKDLGRKRQLMLRVIGSLKNTLDVERANTFLLWKFTSMAPEDVPSEAVLEVVPECAGFKDETLVDAELQSFTRTEPPLVEERKQQISTNIVARHWRLSAVKFTKPARPHESLDFWDKLLDAKYDYDREDLQAGKKPLLFSEFTLEHLLKSLGNRRSMQDQLGANLPTLYRLTQEGQQYAQLISRLLQLFHGSPAPLEGQVLVVQHRKLFSLLAEAYTRSRAERKLPEKSLLDLAATGGEAPLSMVLSEFYDRLRPTEFVVEHWLRHLKPSNKSLAEFVLMLVAWRLRSTGTDPQKFWQSVDASSQGEVAAAAFADAVRNTGLQVSKRLVIEIGAVTKSAFDAAAATNLDGDDCVVSKAGFLTGVLEAFLARVRRAAVIYTEAFAATGKSQLSKTEFVSKSSEMESGHSEEVLEKVFDEAVSLSGAQDAVDRGSFVRVWIRHLIMDIARPPVSVPEMHLLVEPRALEYNLETGIKSTTTTKTTKTTTTTVKRVVVKKS